MTSSEHRTEQADPTTEWAYDRETAISPAGPGRWMTTVGRHWNINDNPNGGYALSPLLKAMAAELPGHPDPLSVTTHFLRPALADEDAELNIDVVRSGRRTATVRGSMVQGGKPRLESIATFGDVTGASSGEQRLEIEPPELPDPEDCIDRSQLLQDVELALLSRVEVRANPADVWSDDQSGGADPPAPGADAASPGSTAGEVARLRGWLRFADGRAADPLALVLFADCFPPSVFNVFGRSGWVPTIELTVHVRRRPVPGWIRADFVTREVSGGLLIEDGLLWDATGQVVAQSRQLAMLAA